MKIRLLFLTRTNEDDNPLQGRSCYAERTRLSSCNTGENLGNLGDAHIYQGLQIVSVDRLLLLEHIKYFKASFILTLERATSDHDQVHVQTVRDECIPFLLAFLGMKIIELENSSDLIELSRPIYKRKSWRYVRNHVLRSVIL